MSKFLEGIVEFRCSSEIEAYDKIVSKWLKEAKEGGYAEQLLDEMIFYSEKVEKEQAVKEEHVKNVKSEHQDGSRTIFIK